MAYDLRDEAVNVAFHLEAHAAGTMMTTRDAVILAARIRAALSGKPLWVAEPVRKAAS